MLRIGQKMGRYIDLNYSLQEVSIARNSRTFRIRWRVGDIDIVQPPQRERGQLFVDPSPWTKSGATEGSSDDAFDRTEPLTESIVEMSDTTIFYRAE